MMRRFVFGAIGAIFLSVSWVTFVSVRPAAALSGADFQAGRIVDDAVFYNVSSMNSDQIQRFLETKVPTCDTNGAQSSSHWNSGANRYYTRAEWGALNGNAAPYTCLQNYRQDISPVAADSYCKAISAGTSLLASEIIARVASACNISPKVLIVLLQKEQGLVTDDWPWQDQYKAATGFGCPDTAACDQQYSGFFNQVYRAGRQFQIYTKLPSSFSTRGSRSSFVLYNPNTNCGGSNQYIQGQATANLYNYTPYQPNGAALSNLSGSGDSCSAYGNRNFWVYFNNWFGSPTVSADAIDQPAAQHRIQTVTIDTKQYVFYYDAFQQVLRLSTLDTANNTWNHEVLDGSSAAGGGRIDASIGSTVSAVQYNGYLQVFYYDQTHGNLRHAWTGPDGWHFENLDGDLGSNAHRDGDVGFNPSLTNYGGSMQLFYYDYSRGNLRHAWTDNTGWHFENLDGDPGSNSHYDGNVGMNPSAIDADGSLQLYYYDCIAGNLRHAWTDNTGWHFENLDGDPGSNSHRSADVGMTPSVATYSGSFLQLYYYDATYDNLRHAWTGPDGWHFENLDGDPGSVGHDDGNAGIDVNVSMTGSTISLYYYNQTSGNLKHAYADNTGWHFENIFPSVVY